MNKYFCANREKTHCMIYKTCMKEEAQFSLFQYPCFCMGKLITDKTTIGAPQIWYNYSAM